MIISCSGIKELPARVKDWMECWARLANRQNSALVTLINQQANIGATVATHSYLRRLMDSRKIDFFPHCTSPLRMSHPE